jgi:DNA-binding MarR family transcriptional regulator
MFPPQATLQLEDSFAYLVYRSARLLRYHFARFAESQGLDISQEQFFLLNKLAGKPQQTQTELGDGLFDDRPNITRMLVAMEESGWLRRQPDPQDARKVRVSLTRKGAAVHRRLHGAVLAERRRLFAGLTSSDLRDLKDILATLEKNTAGRLPAQSPPPAGRRPGPRAKRTAPHLSAGG